jgi:hypothetical protein
METDKQNNCCNDKLILVYYVDVRNVDKFDIPTFIHGVMNNIKLNSPIIGEIIALPIWNDSRVECINPKYITEPELIREHRLKMDELEELIEKYINKNKDHGK